MTISKKIKIILLLLSLSLTMAFMSDTYSRYVVDTTSNVEVSFAKWQILVSNADITSGSISSIELTPVVDENSNVAQGKIAPSSKGHFDIVINPENVDVSFEYAIKLAVLNENMPDLMITKYSILPKGYIEGNVQWVTYQSNLSKHVMTMEQLYEFCRKVLDHANQQPSQPLTKLKGSETND